MISVILYFLGFFTMGFLPIYIGLHIFPLKKASIAIIGIGFAPVLFAIYNIFIVLLGIEEDS